MRELTLKEHISMVVKIMAVTTAVVLLTGILSIDPKVGATAEEVKTFTLWVAGINGLIVAMYAFVDFAMHHPLIAGTAVLITATAFGGAMAYSYCATAFAIVQGTLGGLLFGVFIDFLGFVSYMFDY